MPATIRWALRTEPSKLTRLEGRLDEGTGKLIFRMPLTDYGCPRIVNVQAPQGIEVYRGPYDKSRGWLLFIVRGGDENDNTQAYLSLLGTKATTGIISLLDLPWHSMDQTATVFGKLIDNSRGLFKGIEGMDPREPHPLKTRKTIIKDKV